MINVFTFAWDRSRSVRSLRPFKERWRFQILFLLLTCNQCELLDSSKRWKFFRTSYWGRLKPYSSFSTFGPFQVLTAHWLPKRIIPKRFGPSSVRRISRAHPREPHVRLRTVARKRRLWVPSKLPICMTCKGGQYKALVAVLIKTHRQSQPHEWGWNSTNQKQTLWGSARTMRKVQDSTGIRLEDLKIQPAPLSAA